MAVPRTSELRQGVGVNIVLKADQSSGRLTTGQVSDILTKGDHPRGIKVRLSDGQIGRVQSLASQPPPTRSEVGPQGVTHQGARGSIYKFQDDYREDPTPKESRSLEDYVRIKPAKAKRTKRIVEEQGSMQEQLEAEFPKFDTALIAAILTDHPQLESARIVLQSIVS